MPPTVPIERKNKCSRIRRELNRAPMNGKRKAKEMAEQEAHAAHTNAYTHRQFFFHRTALETVSVDIQQEKKIWKSFGEKLNKKQQ